MSHIFRTCLCLPSVSTTRSCSPFSQPAVARSAAVSTRANTQISDDELGTADAALNAHYAAEDAAFAEAEPEVDCETILTTASNVDNRPSVLSGGRPASGGRVASPPSL